MRSWVWFAILAAVSCTPEGGDTGYDVGDFSDPAACPECEIELVEVAVLGNAADHASVWEGAGQMPCVVDRMDTGEYLLSAPVGGGEILVYGGEGRTNRTIGRPGEGPGEFGSELRFAIGPRDTIYVLDDENVRFQMMAPSGDYVRSFSLSSRVGTFALLSGGEILIHPSPDPRTAESLPLFKLLSPSGEEIVSAGQRPPDPTRPTVWVVGSAADGGFWEANPRRYEVNHRGTDGEVTSTIRRTVDWFPPDAEVDPGYPMTAPGPTTIDHLWDDGGGLLWVYLRRPDDDWTPPSSPGISPTVADPMVDIVVEVLDLERSRLVASLRLDEWYGAACGDNLLYRVFYSESGDTRMRVLEPRLVGY